MADTFEAEREKIRKLKNELDKVNGDIRYEAHCLYSLRDYSDTLSEEASEMICNISGPDALDPYNRYQEHLNSAKNLIKREKELKYEIELAESYLKSQKETYRQVKVFFFIVASLLLLFIYFRFIK